MTDATRKRGKPGHVVRPEGDRSPDRFNGSRRAYSGILLGISHKRHVLKSGTARPEGDGGLKCLAPQGRLPTEPFFVDSISRSTGVPPGYWKWAWICDMSHLPGSIESAVERCLRHTRLEDQENNVFEPTSHISGPCNSLHPAMKCSN